MIRIDKRIAKYRVEKPAELAAACSLCLACRDVCPVELPLPGEDILAEIKGKNQRSVFEALAVAADYARMRTECQRLHDAQVLVDQLYHRWHELESVR